MAIYEIEVTTVGAAGAAAGSADMEPGDLFESAAQWKGQVPWLEAIQVEYDPAAPATTDVTLTEVGGLGRTLLTLANNKTSGTYYPRYAVHDAVGAAQAAREMIALTGPLRVSVAGCDALAPAVTVRAHLIMGRMG